MSKRKAVEADSSGASQPAGAGKPADTLMQAIRTLGRLPKETRKAPKDERQLAEKLRRARRAGQLSGEEEAELAAMSANEIGTLEEADAPPDPMDPFADEAANRLEQDVLMATNGIRPRTVMRRIARYKKYMTQPAALQMDFVQKYKDQVVQAAAASCVGTPYVAGDEIEGDALRSFSEDPIITASVPLDAKA